MRKVFIIAVSAIAALVVIILSFHVFCDVGAGEIVVLQGVDGKMTVWSNAGWKYQGFGTITKYRKSEQLTFKAPTEKKKGDESPEEPDRSVHIRFADKGSARISGSISYDLPIDQATMLKVHEKFGSMEAIVSRLVTPAVTKAVYNSGPLMSAGESAGQKRGDLIKYLQDQSTLGVFKTMPKEIDVEDYLAPPIKTVSMIDVPVLDDITKQPKVDPKTEKVITKQEPQITERPAVRKVTTLQVVMDEKGQPVVQEKSITTEFGIRLYNFTVDRILYEPDVQNQINLQRNMEMAVQTKISEAKQAEQEVVTTEKKGQASAAEAKWKQEVLKAQAVTEAEQKKEVAARDLDTAKLQRQAMVERAEGEAEAKKLVMQADGALEKKLAAYVEVNKTYAAEFGKQRWVSEFYMGGSSNGQHNAASDFMTLLQAKAAKDLSLDLSVKTKTQ